MGGIAQRYDAAGAIAAAVFIFVGGITAGFAVCAAALPLLARVARTPRDFAAIDGRPGSDAVVLLACTDPDRYDPRVVAYRQNVLAETAGIEIPPTALPFVFFAEKARYRAAGRVLPGPSLARSLAERLETSNGALRGVDVAWCYDPDSLARAIARRGPNVRDVAVVVAGAVESAWLDEIRQPVDALVRESPSPRVAFGPTVWNDRLLAVRMVERILAATAGASASDVGVVLVVEGMPADWEKRYQCTSVAENYFNQRVRVLLGEAGVGDRCVRTASLDWQVPDVTEAVRHVATLGCSRIIVAPSTIAFPTLETMLDLQHVVRLARVPESVSVVTLSPWGDDEGFADAIRRSALTALGELHSVDEGQI